MKSIFRSLLVWLMLLALPYQGFASAGMLARIDPPAPTATQAAASLPPCHQAAMAHEAAPATMAMTFDRQAGEHGAKPGAGQHGKCASCCIGAAMAPALAPGLALAPPQFVSIPFCAGHLPSVDPSLLERPPKTVLA